MPHSKFWNLLSKKITGEASPEELRELEVLIKEHPELIYSAEQIEKIWKLPAQDINPYESELAFQQHLNQLNEKGIYLQELETPASMYEYQKENFFSLKRIIQTAFIVFILIGIVGVIFWQSADKSNSELLVQNKNFTGEVSTRMGHRTKLVLPDSTVVWLNAGSKLNYNEEFGITNRNTTLSGEAYFDVKKSKLPFIIQANSVKIKVLGTAFNVKSYPNEKTTETSLVRGEVEITLDKRPGEKFILKQNEKLIVANDIKSEENLSIGKMEPKVVLSSLTQSNDSSIIETSWVENKLIFQDESFAELAVKMERWYGVEISFANDKLKRERLSGTFTKESIQEALEILQMTTPFRFKIKSNSIFIE